MVEPAGAEEEGLDERVEGSGEEAGKGLREGGGDPARAGNSE